MRWTKQKKHVQLPKLLANVLGSVNRLAQQTHCCPVPNHDGIQAYHVRKSTEVHATYSAAVASLEAMSGIISQPCAKKMRAFFVRLSLEIE